MEVTNRFKGLDLIDRVPENYGHCTGDRDQDHPQEKEMQKGKLEALQIAEKRREAKGKEEKERFTHLNAEF